MLNDKQQRFVTEYLVDLNATQAAIRAGYSEKTARSIGHELLTKPDVEAAVAAGRAKLSEKTGITAERVLAEIEKVAFANPRAVMAWGPGGVILRDSEELTEDEAAIISEVAETKDGMRVKLHSKLDALGKLGQHLGLFKDRVEHSGTVEHKVDLSANDIARRIAFTLARAGRETK